MVASETLPLTAPLPTPTPLPTLGTPTLGTPTPLPPAIAPPVVTFEDLDNSVRNGKKKLYWSAFEVVLVTAQPDGAAPLETRYDAYQVNHNHLKKLHAGARGPHYVRVECKYCTAPRFTQSITVSTKKFEEHYMTLHALDALASADAKKAQQHQQQRKHGKAAAAVSEGGDDGESDERMDEEKTVEGGELTRSKRTRKATADSGDVKRLRREASTRDEDDHVAAMQGAAAAVVALSGGNNATRTAESTSDPLTSKGVHPHAPQPPTTTTTLPSSLVDSSILLDPADSDTKRAKKSYWTAYEVVICERVPRTTSGADDMEGGATDGSPGSSGETVTRETRQDAWRVNHNALRRLHLDPANDTTVRVECRFCDEPKFNQSITVSTRKFEQHYYYEHGDESQRQALEERLGAKAVEAATEENGVALEGMASLVPKRRKSWKALLLERETPLGAGYGGMMKAPYGGASGGVRSVTARYQRALLLNWLIQDDLPLTTISSEHFQAFVASLDRKFEVPLPDMLHAQLQQRLDVTQRGIQQQLLDERAAGTAFAVTIDTFSVHTTGKKESSFVSVTVHYVSREWERQQVLLACRAVPEVASPESVWTVVRSVLKEFGIPAESVVSATVRHANAMPVVSSGLAPERKPSAVVLLCAAEALNTIVEAGVDVVRQSTTELQSLTTIIKQEGSSTTINWMDFYIVLNSIVQRQTPKDESTPPPSTETAISPETLTTVQAIVAILEPFVRVAQELSATVYPNMSMVFQYFRHLDETLTPSLDTKATEKNAVTPVVQAMQTALGQVADKVVRVDALAACVLDPRFRFAHISSGDEKRIRTRITDEIAAITRGSDASVSHASLDGRADLGDAGVGADKATRQTRSLFEELATSGKRTSIGSIGSSTATPSASSPAVVTSTNASGSAELDEYLSLEDEDFSVNVLQWWQAHEAQFPTLARVARQFLGLVGTSLPADELFSPAGQQRVVRRSVLDPETLDICVMARAYPESLVDQPSAPPARAARIASPAADLKRRKTNASSPPQPMAAVAPPLPPMPEAIVETSDKDSLAVIV